MNRTFCLLLVSLSCLPAGFFLHIACSQSRAGITYAVTSTDEEKLSAFVEGNIWFSMHGITISVTPHSVQHSSRGSYPEQYLSKASSGKLELAQVITKQIGEQRGFEIGPVSHLELVDPPKREQITALTPPSSFPEEYIGSKGACESGKPRKRPLVRLLGL